MGRERKSPYLGRNIYLAILLVLATSLATVIGEVWTSLASYTAFAARLFLIVALVFVVWSVLRVANRDHHLRDDNLLKSLAPVRWMKGVIRRFGKQKPYEHNSEALSAALVASLRAIPALNYEKIEKASARFADTSLSSSSSVFLKTSSFRESDALLVDLLVAFLTNGCSAQITSAARHPAELIFLLAKDLNAKAPGKAKQSLKRLAVVDAYTPHFGFTDSIHQVMKEEIEKLGVMFFLSRPTFAGIHSATARAFNQIRKEEGKVEGPRQPCLLIYEGTAALADLESPEQLRVFIRHVLPSERLWGGMFSVWIEPCPDDQTDRILAAYCDVTQEMMPNESSGT